jgi:GNAT superfamily N-acetyltransferase
MIYRDIALADIPAIFDVRSATVENPFSRDALYSLGITEESVESMLSTTHHGWICEEAGRIVGFSIADGNTGELWVIAVLPDFEGKGIGSRLLSIAEEWLASQGWPEFWLWTSTDTSLRAYQLYQRHGWRDSEIRGDQLYMKKRAEQGAAANP